MSEAAASGIVQGKTIILDAPVPVLDGRRVRILIESEDEAQLTTEDQRRLWAQWLKTGPQGPIEDNEAPEFP